MAISSDTASLIIKVDSTSAELGSKRLDDFSQSAGNAQRKVVDLNKSFYQGSGPAVGFADIMGKVEKSTAKHASSAEKAAASTTKLASAAASATEASRTLSLATGGVARELGVMGGELARGNYTRLEGSFITLANRTGLLAKAFSPLGLAIGAAASASALLVSAYIDGQKESDAYNKAVILTGNVAGVTSGQLASMAKALADVTGSQHDAANALAAVTSSGKFTADQIQLVTTAALQMQQATGQAIGDTIKQFSDLAGDPSSAIAKLNDQQHFLTLSLYDQITALQNLGQTQDAADLAEKTYASSLAERTAQIKANLGTLETAWDGVKTHAKQAWDAILDIGRPESDDDKLLDLQGKANALGKQLEALKNAAPLGGSGYGNLGNQARDQEIADLQAKFDAAKKAYYDAEDSQTAADQAAQQKASTQTAQDLGIGLSQEAAQYASSEVKRAQAIAKAHGEANAAIAAAEKVQDADLRAKLIANAKANEQAIIAGIQSKAPKKKTTDPFASLNSLVQNAQVQDTGNGGQQDTLLNKQAADILKIVDAGAKLIVSGHDIATVQAKVAVGVEATNDRYAKQATQLKQKNIVAVQQYQASLDKQNAALQQTIDSQVAKIGMGDKEYQQQQQINDLYVKGAQALTDLQLKRDAVAAKGGDTSVLDQNIAALKANTDKQVMIVKQGYANMDAAQADWSKGFTAAFANFNDQAANVATQSAQLFINAFTGMTDAIVNFAQTGKLNFSDLAQSILSSLIKIETQIALSKALSSIFGSGMSATQQSQLNAGADSFIGSVVASAKGNVFSGGDISNLSGSIVSAPTWFSGTKINAFANGGNVAGEAGPEAILPLKRGSNGKLGVQSSGAGSNVQVEVNITNNGQAVNATQTSTQVNGQKIVVGLVLDAVANDIATGGKTAKAVQQRFGVQRRGIPVSGG